MRVELEDGAVSVLDRGSGPYLKQPGDRPVAAACVKKGNRALLKKAEEAWKKGDELYTACSPASGEELLRLPGEGQMFLERVPDVCKGDSLVLIDLNSGKICGIRKVKSIPSRIKGYYAGFLNNAERSELLTLCRDEYFDAPLLRDVHLNHVTLVYRPDEDHEIFRDIPAESILQAEVTHAVQEKGVIQVLRVRPLNMQMTRSIPDRRLHITVSCAGGIQPSYANELLERVEMGMYGDSAVKELDDPYTLRLETRIQPLAF